MLVNIKLCSYYILYVYTCNNMVMCYCMPYANTHMFNNNGISDCMLRMRSISLSPHTSSNTCTTFPSSHTYTTHNPFTHTHTHLCFHTANPNVRSNPNSKEVTPLHIAAGSGHLACLQLLVQLGGDIMARDTEQLTPVDYACVNGQDLCLKYLNDVLGKLDLSN